MKKLIQTLAISGALTLGTGQKAFSNEVKTQVDTGKENVTQLIEKKEISNEDLNKIFDEKLVSIDIPEEKKQEIKAIFNDKEFKSQVFQILKKEAVWSLESVIISLILGFLYGYAYNSTIRKVRKQFMPIDPKSFGIFGMTSGGMVLLNGFVPGSLVYFESFVLASLAVYLHYQNVKKGRTYNALYNDFFEENPLPVVRYNKDGTPLIWNKKMEEETGYSLEDINKYFLKKGEVMSLLYSGEELERVRQYIASVEKTGKGYKNVAFTMITKGGEHKTFLWTTQPDGQGGTIRTARQLTDELEIQKELNETLQLLRLDTLTGVLNRKALDDDLKFLFNHKERKNETSNIVIVMMDIDNFKLINDSFGHDAGDEVLKTLTSTISNNIRGEDKIYRIGGDEFVVIFKTNDFDLIVKKINNIREIFFNQLFAFNSRSLSGIGTSWGVKDVDLVKIKLEIEEQKTQKIEDITIEVDHYMYAIKCLKFITKELLDRGIPLAYITEKNAIAYPVFHEDKSFVGVKIINSHGQLFVSKVELDLIVQRKQEEAMNCFQYMDAMKHLKLIIQKLFESDIPHSNITAYPLYNEDNLFIGINIIHPRGQLSVSKEMIDLFIQKEEQITLGTFQ